MESPQQDTSNSTLLTTPACLTIAGSDSGGEAGIQADLQTFNDFQCHGLSVLTATTAQNRDKIISINSTPDQALTDQLTAVNDFFQPEYVKVGLLTSTRQIKISARYTENKTAVIDPILKATSGAPFLTDELRELFKASFLNNGNIITPNFNELCWLLSLSKDTSIPNILTEAQYLLQTSNCFIYLKGGHTEDPASDFLIQKNRIYKYISPTLSKTYSTHGTGCRVSSGICAALAKNYSVLEACQVAKNYVFHTLRNNTSSNGQYVMHSPGLFTQFSMNVNYQEVIL